MHTNKLPYRKIEEFAYVTDGIHESIQFDEDSLINLISAKSPKENIFDLSGNECISPEQHNKSPRTTLQELVQSAHSSLRQSKEIYQQAEDLLLSEKMKPQQRPGSMSS